MTDVKQKKRQIVRVEGKAEKKNQAFSNALNQIHGKVLKESDDVILRIEPLHTAIVLAEEESYVENFLFFFLLFGGFLSDSLWKEFFPRVPFPASGRAMV